MHVIGHTSLPRIQDQGRTRIHVAGEHLGGSAFDMWMEALQPNAVAELQPSDRDRVALVLAGHGDLRFDGASQRFRAPCSLVMPRDNDFEVVNIGAETLTMVLAIARPDRELAPELPASP